MADDGFVPGLVAGMMILGVVLLLITVPMCSISETRTKLATEQCGPYYSIDGYKITCLEPVNEEKKQTQVQEAQATQPNCEGDGTP